MIPEFPDCREIALDDKPLFDAIFAAKQPEISAYTFTNIYAWRGAYDAVVSRVGDHVLVLCDLGDRLVSLEPLGEGPIAPVAEEAVRRTDRAMAFERLSAEAAAELESHGFAIEPDRDNWDYVYLAEDLITLAGRKYDGKRNQIAHAKSQLVDYDYVRMDAAIAAECEDFADLWCEERHCETVEGLRRERCAIYQMLMNFDALGIVGGAIRADGRIVAFSLGEALNDETLVVHVEKADSRIEGLYQLINNEFCAEARVYRYVNREQDLGVPGLRKAKESYHPARMVEAYSARLL